MFYTKYTCKILRHFFPYHNKTFMECRICQKFDDLACNFYNDCVGNYFYKEKFSSMTIYFGKLMQFSEEN